MAKTVSISEKIHLLILEKQMNILRKYGKNVRIYDVVNAVLKRHLNDKDVEIELGLESDIEFLEE